MLKSHYTFSTRKFYPCACFPLKAFMPFSLGLFEHVFFTSAFYVFYPTQFQPCLFHYQLSCVFPYTFSIMPFPLTSFMCFTLHTFDHAFSTKPLKSHNFHYQEHALSTRPFTTNYTRYWFHKVLTMAFWNIQSLFIPIFRIPLVSKSISG